MILLSWFNPNFARTWCTKSALREQKKKKEHREKEISVHEAVSSAYKYLAVPLKLLCVLFGMA